MKAAFLTGIGQVEIRDVPRPELTGQRDVLLRVCAVGVCGSDVHYYTTGRIGEHVVEFPWVVGHEPAGVVAEAGSEVTGLAPGQRVVIEPAISCGQCDQCRRGRRHTCLHIAFISSPTERPGALADCIVMPAEACYPMPDGMTMAQGALTEPLSIGLYAQRLAAAPPGAAIAILGTGPIGLSVLLALRDAGPATIYATDLLEPRLALARRFGAEWTASPGQRDIVAAIGEREPHGLDVVFECAGEQSTLDQAVDLLRPGGTLLMIGIPETERVSFNIDRLRRKEIRIQNVRRQNECVAPAIERVASGAIDVDPLVTHRFPLEEAQAAFDLVANYRDGVVKAVIDVNEE